MLFDKARRLGVRPVKREQDSQETIGQGRNVIDLLPERIRYILRNPGGESHNGDFSRQDSAIITAILSAGYTPEDAYTTFAVSPRGHHAEQRKNSHFDDYLQRTVRKAAAFLGHQKIEVDFASRRPVLGGEGILTEKAADVSVTDVHWVWYPYIPAGKLTIIAGDPGMAKSTISLDLLARISRGRSLPLGARSFVGTCAVASAEDAAEDTITPRLIAADADLSRIEIVREVMIEGGLQYLTFPRDLDRLRQRIIDSRIRVLVIDPMDAFLEKGTDAHKNQDIRRVLAPIEAIAEETGASIIVIAHLNKKEDSAALYRVGGSIGFTGASRSVLMVSQIDEETRVLHSIKSNLSHKPPALSYRVRQVIRKRKKEEDWKGIEEIKSNQIRWIAEVDFDPNARSATDSDKATNEACEFLREVLIDSEIPFDEVMNEAKKAGIPRHAVIRARLAMGVTVHRRNGDWVWKTPD